MNSLVIKFTNKLRPNEYTSELQIDQSIDIDGLTTLLNTITNKETEYFFFYKNQRIYENLAKMAEKYSLNIEEIQNIEFIDQKDIKADHLIECDDVVISLVSKNDEVFYLTYTGNVYRYDNNTKINMTEMKIRRIVSSDRMLLGISDKYILDIENNKIIYESDDMIQSIDVFDNTIAVASNDKIILISDGNPTEVHSGDDLYIREVKINSIMVSWIQKHNTIGFYCFENKKVDFIVSKCCLHKLRLFEDKIVSTTGDNMILIVEDLKCRYVDVPYRLSSSIKPYKSGFFYSSQHDIILVDVSDESKLKEQMILKVEGQVNDILVVGDSILIANDNFISKFKIKEM